MPGPEAVRARRNAGKGLLRTLIGEAQCVLRAGRRRMTQIAGPPFLSPDMGFIGSIGVWSAEAGDGASAVWEQRHKVWELESGSTPARCSVSRSSYATSMLGPRRRLARAGFRLRTGFEFGFGDCLQLRNQL